MKLKFKVCLVFLLLIILYKSFIFSSPRAAQDLVPSGHWIYNALDSLELEMARYNFIDVTPMSVQQIRAALLDIIPEKLSESGKILYERVQNFLQESDFSFNVGIFSLGLEPKVNVEGYFKTNKNLEWNYNYHERENLLDIPITLKLGDYLSIFMGLHAGQNRNAMQQHDNYINQCFIPQTFDPFLARTNYASTGYLFNNGVGINLRIGSGAQNVGRALLGSVIQSDYLTDTMYGTFTLYSPFLKYMLNITQLNAQTYLYYHLIEFRLFKKLTFSFLEGVLPYSAFDLRFVNPLAIYHGFALFNEYNLTSYFGIKLNFVPCKNFRIYFLYAQDEHQLASELKSGGGNTPEGNGMQLGFEVQSPLKKGFLKFNLEGLYSSPYLYIKDSPNWTMARTYREMVAGTDDFYEWLGSPFGPDSYAAKFIASYEKPEKWSAALSYTFGARGEFSSSKIFRDVNWNTTNAQSSFGNKSYPQGWIYPTETNEYSDGRSYKSPHGIAEYCNVISARGEWFPTRWLSLILQPSYSFVFNAGHEKGRFEQGFEVALSCKFELTKISKKTPSFDFLLKDKHDKNARKEVNEVLPKTTDTEEK